MATKTKPTPVLKGKDAEKFEKNARDSEQGKNSVSIEEYKRMLENFKEFNFKY